MADQSTASIDIAATPEAIIGVIADVERYPEWTPGIEKAEVLSVYEEDERPCEVQFTMSQTGLTDVQVYEYDWDGAARVEWHLTSGKAVKALAGSYTLTPKGSSTTVTYALSVDLAVSVPGIIKRRTEKTIIDAALKGLKRRVEA